MTFSCHWCTKPYKTMRGLKRHLEGHHNEMAAAAKRTTERQDKFIDVDTECDKNAMDESGEYEESKGDDSVIHEDPDESVATGKIRRSTRLAPKNVISIGKLSSLFFYVATPQFFHLDRLTII